MGITSKTFQLTDIRLRCSPSRAQTTWPHLISSSQHSPKHSAHGFESDLALCSPLIRSIYPCISRFSLSCWHLSKGTNPQKWYLSETWLYKALMVTNALFYVRSIESLVEILGSVHRTRRSSDLKPPNRSAASQHFVKPMCQHGHAWRGLESGSESHRPLADSVRPSHRCHTHTHTDTAAYVPAITATGVSVCVPSVRPLRLPSMFCPVLLPTSP